MKLFSGFLLSCFVAVFAVVGCSGSSTYSDLVKEQKATIRSYINRHGISVTSTLPTNYSTTAWGDKAYYLSSTGLYFHLSQVGDAAAIASADSARTGDVIVIRYIKVDLTEPADTVESTWTSLDSAYPYSMTYGSSSSEPTAWQEAIFYMKYSGAQAEMIVPGSLGTSTDQSNVTPYYYKISIKKLPR
ncbi:MAG: hypothetical protein H6Q17_390 [Bacteroidetes bacterium]|nr:hypothetical protein [Bacteroidota bacterium]